MATASIASSEPTIPKSEKKQKKEKKDKAEKKRVREEEESVVETERRHKKSKSVSVERINAEEQDDTPEPQATNGDSEVKQKKKKKDKKAKAEQSEDADPEENSAALKEPNKELDVEATLTQEAEAADELEDGATQEKLKKKKSKKHREDAEIPGTPSKPPKVALTADPDAMDVDEPAQTNSSEIYSPPDMPAKPQFPFYSQTVSLYEPIYPQGWSQPVTNCEYQHLQHLKNRYVPSLRGVLLDYKNVTLGDNPGRTGAAKVDEDPTILKSFNEYAVGFGWITADVDLFVPSRGAWMEGSVNLQTEGHIGVVCFGRFNASIEARRLPPAWKWVSNEDPEAFGMEETASVVTADDHGVVRQIHSTGFWVDESGNRVKGKIRFRIRNFDVGMSGETSYLSLEGTMLDKDSEKKLVKEEAQLAEQRKGKKGGRRVERRRAPEFAMTRFTDEEEQTEPTEVQTEGQAVQATE
ncbi:DNA-directed RNA polymerase I subunit RPA43-like protein [Cladobotryum mycophilum]|uniref:DNA-directed RNA polymerase subunit n=1 Tax=Cladobotryum mycophilum TaxID=491253 RepID=A0ABR0SJ57_9HYPO